MDLDYHYIDHIVVKRRPRIVLSGEVLDVLSFYSRGYCTVHVVYTLSCIKRKTLKMLIRKMCNKCISLFIFNTHISKPKTSNHMNIDHIC